MNCTRFGPGQLLFGRLLLANWQLQPSLLLPGQHPRFNGVVLEESDGQGQRAALPESPRKGNTARAVAVCRDAQILDFCTCVCSFMMMPMHACVAGHQKDFLPSQTPPTTATRFSFWGFSRQTQALHRNESSRRPANPANTSLASQQEALNITALCCHRLSIF